MTIFILLEDSKGYIVINTVTGERSDYLPIGNGGALRYLHVGDI